MKYSEASAAVVVVSTFLQLSSSSKKQTHTIATKREKSLELSTTGSPRSRPTKNYNIYLFLPAKLQKKPQKGSQGEESEDDNNIIESSIMNQPASHRNHPPNHRVKLKLS